MSDPHTSFDPKEESFLANGSIEKRTLRSWFSRKELWRIVKYGMSGLSGGLIQVGLLYVFVDRFKLWYLHAVVIAFFISLVVAFLLQKYWTFQDFSRSRVHWQSLLYLGIAIWALALNVVGMYVLVDLMHISHLPAQAGVVLVVGFLTFLLNKTFTFHNASHQMEGQ